MRKSLAGDISRFIARQSDRRKQATNKSSPAAVHASDRRHRRRSSFTL